MKYYSELSKLHTYNYLEPDDDWDNDNEIELMLYYYKIYEKMALTDLKGFYKLFSTKLEEVFQYSRTPEAIQKKMAKLKNTYKEAIDNAGPKRTGTGPIRCKFFEVRVF